jgi:3-isopropylmalate dehydrogenase
LAPVATTPATAIREPDWVTRICDPDTPARQRAPLIGVLPGEGVGPEVVGAALSALGRLEAGGGQAVTVEFGGPIGKTAEREAGAALPDDVLAFCRDVLERGGAILSGPGGGRYVYDLRQRLGLFIKISPIDGRLGFTDASPLRPELVDRVDLLMARENLGGVYQGSSTAMPAEDGGSLVEHRFSYAETAVRRFVTAAGRLASSRRGELTVVVKRSGIPRFADLWQGIAEEVGRDQGVGVSFVDVDLMAYQLIERPNAFDVIAAPNLFGDILGDLAAVLLGSRALSFGASYDQRGTAVYQTNHGAAYDIAGSGRANPLGQILSLAALLRESLGLEREAWALEEAVRRTLRETGSTDDLGGDMGTEEMAASVGSTAAQLITAAPG